MTIDDSGVPIISVSNVPIQARQCGKQSSHDVALRVMNEVCAYISIKGSFTREDYSSVIEHIAKGLTSQTSWLLFFSMMTHTPLRDIIGDLYITFAKISDMPGCIKYKTDENELGYRLSNMIIQPRATKAYTLAIPSLNLDSVGIPTNIKEIKEAVDNYRVFIKYNGVFYPVNKEHFAVSLVTPYTTLADGCYLFVMPMTDLYGEGTEVFIVGANPDIKYEMDFSDMPHVDNLMDYKPKDHTGAPLPRYDWKSIYHLGHMPDINTIGR